MLAQRLLCVWVMHHNLKCVYMPVVVPGISGKQKRQQLRRRFTNRIVFALRRR